MNPARKPGARPVSGDAARFHRRLSGYRPTPLRTLTSAANDLGVRSLHVKDESDRFGLPAFKILGASWAGFRLLSSRLGREPSGWRTVDDLAVAFEPLQPLTLVTATDGNHGRAVARAARWFGCTAHILVPAGTASARIDGIASEGATVEIVQGTYDEAVSRASAMAGDRVAVVSDTSWPGYEDVPGWVAEGYETICAEVDDALDAASAARPSHVLVQVGVGALAVAIIRHWAPSARVVGLEPFGANCCYESIAAGRDVVVEGPQESMMAGMNCGTLSTIAWPELREGLDAVVTLSDDRAREAMRLLAGDGIVSGETGAAGLGALLELLGDPAHASVREALDLGSSSHVLVLSTEGATDPANYERIVGRPPAAVNAP
jgi:diaminopropionate ammonia-lyase